MQVGESEQAREKAAKWVKVIFWRQKIWRMSDEHVGGRQRTRPGSISCTNAIDTRIQAVCPLSIVVSGRTGSDICYMLKRAEDRRVASTLA